MTEEIAEVMAAFVAVIIGTVLVDWILTPTGPLGRLNPYATPLAGSSSAGPMVPTGASVSSQPMDMPLTF